MRKQFTKVVAGLLCGAMMSSCIGSFTLTNRLLGWNEHVGNKFVNELVFFAFWVLPVYEVCAAADVLVLNSIEFWSGTNPIACGEKIIDGTDGKYLVKSDDKGYDIVSCTDGSSMRLNFDADTQSWSYSIGEQSGVLFRFVDDDHISLPVDGGNSWQTFEASASGLLAYRATSMPLFAAK